MESSLNTERKGTVDYIVAKVMEKGRITFDAGTIRRYELGLPYCSFTIQTHQSISPIIEIAENFGDPKFIPRSWQDRIFDGVRILYRGGDDGLDEVALQGIYHPDVEGKVLLPAESLMRFKESTDGRQLTREDTERFDAFLKYARREL
jgi:hypothetical protein